MTQQNINNLSDRKAENQEKNSERLSYKEGGNDINFLNTAKKIDNPLWLSVSEAAKLGGVQAKTIRRAIKSKKVQFKIIKDRYQINLSSLIVFLQSSTKLQNKLQQNGIGQYVKRWDE